MTRQADCRLCRYFIKVDSLEWMRLSFEEREKAHIQAFRRGQRLLGYCTAYNRAVTYYEGTCPRFKPKHEADSRQLPLTHFIQEVTESEVEDA